MQVRSVGDVRSALAPYGIEVRVLQADTSTALMAAEALTTSVSAIVKSLLFVADGKPVLALVSGDRKIDRRKLAGELGVGKVRIAPLEDVPAVTGYRVGGVPPVAHATPLPIYMDRHLYEHQEVYAAAGAADAVFAVSPEQLREITAATIIDSAT